MLKECGLSFACGCIDSEENEIKLVIEGQVELGAPGRCRQSSLFTRMRVLSMPLDFIGHSFLVNQQVLKLPEFGG
jgi:hypothetical protein